MASTLSRSLPRPPFADGMRWYSYSAFLRRRFGARVHKVTIDAGMTCPNADGTKAVGGCIYCDNRSFSFNAREGRRHDIRRQIDLGVERLTQMLGERKFLAYFQAGTNTYAPVPELKQLWDVALNHPKIEGVIVGTRPDCVPGPVLDLMEEYARKAYFSVEYGLQTLDDEILRWTNRGHDSACFFDAVERTRGRGIDICVHVILGFPQESPGHARMLGRALGEIDVQGIKIHNLHVVQNTPLEPLYSLGKLRLPTMEQYARLAADVLERIRPTVSIQRLTGDAPGDWLVAPEWCRRRPAVVQAIDTELRRRNSWQGKLHE